MSAVMSLASTITTHQCTSKVSEIVTHFNEILLSEKRLSAIPWASQVSLDTVNLLLLIDADSLGDEDAVLWIEGFNRSGLNLSIHLCANRSLKSLSTKLSKTQQQREINTKSHVFLHQVPPGNNSADLTLIDIGEKALKTDEYNVMIVCTQDRDLFPVILSWKAAHRAAFLIPLRLDDSGLHLVKRCHKQGISMVDRHLRVLRL